MSREFQANSPTRDPKQPSSALTAVTSFVDLSGDGGAGNSPSKGGEQHAHIQHGRGDPRDVGLHGPQAGVVHFGHHLQGHPLLLPGWPPRPVAVTVTTPRRSGFWVLDLRRPQTRIFYPSLHLHPAAFGHRVANCTLCYIQDGWSKTLM